MILRKIRNMNNKGFTLIELIVVMAIVAILVLLAAPRLLGYTKDAKVTTMKQDTKILSDAVEMYYINNNEWPLSENERPKVFNIGGVDEVYPVNSEEMSKYVKLDINDIAKYYVIIDGDKKGDVVILDGIEDKDGDMHYSKDIKTSNPKNLTWDNSLEGLFEYSKVNNGYHITGFTSTALSDGVPQDLTIPNKHEGREITGIANNAFERVLLNSVKIQPNIKSIGDRAFYKSGLIAIDLSEGLESIGAEAFESNNITNISIPNTVVKIESEAFRGNNIKKLYLGNSLEGIGYSAFRRLHVDKIIIPDSVKEIGASAFFSGSAGRVVIGNSVETIGQKAFMDGNYGKTIVIPDSVINIDYSAFRNSNFEKVIIGNGVKVIGQSAFENSGVRTLVLGNSLNVIGAQAFENNILKGDLIIPDTVHTIEVRAFYENYIKKVTIPTNVKTIGHAAFRMHYISSSTTDDIPGPGVWVNNKYDWIKQ